MVKKISPSCAGNGFKPFPAGYQDRKARRMSRRAFLFVFTNSLTVYGSMA